VSREMAGIAVDNYLAKCRAKATEEALVW